MERWKDIPSYEGLYQASDLGRIRTCEGKTTSSARYPRRVWKQRIMKQKLRTVGKRTDARVSLWKDGKEQTWLVARLVAMTWCDGYAEGLTVNHINGNPHDNSAENLEWISIAANVRHGFDTGLYSSLEKPISLTDEQGQTTEYKSMAAASRAIGRNSNYISGAIKRGYGIYGRNGEKLSARF